MRRQDLPARVRVFIFQESLQGDDLYKYTCNSNDYLEEIQDCMTDLRVGALDVDRLQINMQADYKRVPSFRAALQLMGCDGQCGGTAHRLQ